MKYIILNTEKVDIIDFLGVIENKNTLRYNLQGTEFIVKFKGDTPVDLIGFEQYSHSEILIFINNPVNGWVKEE
tara:strand:- start:4967 stop:5188 length:222 start_codon:yes stop_codon:yes gene_type:complete